jgi:hypothetical protein
MQETTICTRKEDLRLLPFWLLLFASLLLAKLCHLHILWAEEGYGSAAAVQILHGKMLYRDFWFDKPPLAALVYVLWHGEPGFWVRFAGAVYGLACAAAAYRFAKHMWGRTEAIWAASLIAFFLVFDIPASVMTLAPDLLMIFPSIAALDCAARKQAFRSGLWCSVALAVNAKALLIFAVCLCCCWPAWAGLFAGMIAGTAPWFFWLVLSGGLAPYWQQVWWFGARYSRDTFVAHPLREGIVRTLNWAGFHAAIVVAAASALWCRRLWKDPRWFAWILAGVLGIIAGERFFARYYFLLLVPVVLLAAHGLVSLDRTWRAAIFLLLTIPFIRFAPRYVRLAADLMEGRVSSWSDIALNQDSQAAAAIVNRSKQKADTLLVWGYRPDLFAYTELPVVGKFLDSQLLTGVIADRHLTSTQATFPRLAAKNRQALVRLHPTWIIDGLGPLNRALAIDRYPDLEPWLRSRYTRWAQTANCVIYRENAR